MIMSRHKPGVIYLGGNCVFKLTDRMEKYSVISPDLTRNDPAQNELPLEAARKITALCFRWPNRRNARDCCGREQMMDGSG